MVRNTKGIGCKREEGLYERSEAELGRVCSYWNPSTPLRTTDGLFRCSMRGVSGGAAKRNTPESRELENRGGERGCCVYLKSA